MVYTKAIQAMTRAPDMSAKSAEMFSATVSLPKFITAMTASPVTPPGGQVLPGLHVNCVGVRVGGMGVGGRVASGLRC